MSHAAVNVAHVRDASSARAAEYIDLFGSIDAAAEQDREYVLAWAQSVDGRIIDVACGPGQWTHLLHEPGGNGEGVDPVAAFVAEAQRRYPDASYRIGRAEQLGVDD